MIQIFRADFGPQSADSSSDEPLESESDEGLQRVWEAFDCWAESAMWVNGALAQMRTNMFLWCVCVCVFHGCVFDYTRDWVCVCICVCLQLICSSFIHQADSITVRWMFGPSALRSKTHDPFEELFTDLRPAGRISFLQAEICTCRAGTLNLLNVTDYM